MTGSANAVGFQLLSIPDPIGGEPIPVGLWYPSRAPATPQHIGFLKQLVAVNGTVSGRKMPLIVFSHATLGSYESHFDTAIALAEHGYVVAALSHRKGPTHNFAFMLWDRSRQLRRMIDYMLADWPEHGQIDAARVGAFGFSAGGSTILFAIGGKPDFALVAPHCAAHPEEWSCKQIVEHHLTMPALVGNSPHGLYPDPRIRAAVVTAPAVGYLFSRGGLASVTVPVQLWRAAGDTVLAEPWNAEAVRRALPIAPDYHVVVGADHGIFGAPCSAALRADAPSLCEVGDIDATAFHLRFNAQILAFFDKNLAR